MTVHGWLQFLAFCAVVAAVTPVVGRYLSLVYRPGVSVLDRWVGPFETACYRLFGVDAQREMTWRDYAACVLWFSAVSVVALFGLLRLQHMLPLNPQQVPGMGGSLALNTAVSFVTNTNWQSYVPESSASYLIQMCGLAVQNFMSAAVGMAVAAAVIRGLVAAERQTLGNFWVDLTRSWTRVLLPAAAVGALFLVSQGVVQNLKPADTVPLVDQAASTRGGEDAAAPTQSIAQGPVASQEIIKMLGTNGGGFFNANSAHPFENPTPLTNFFQVVLIFVIPSGFVWMLGHDAGSRRHGWAVWGAMAALFVVGVVICYGAESAANPVMDHAAATTLRGNLEGKEVRFGVAGSTLFAVVTTAASCGAVNAMHDSFTPLGGMVPLVNIILGEVVFGGVGAGLYGMVVFIVATVFVTGLMVGRTPEYLGKRLQAFDVQMAIAAILVFPVTVLTLAAASMAIPSLVQASILNPGPHGLTEVMYAYVSAAGNNGSAFAGLSANTTWLNLSLAFAMLIGRFGVIVPVLALAGHLARQPRVAETVGTFPVTTPLFAGILVAVILVVGALTFFPVLSLGPIVEHLAMRSGEAF